MINASYIGRPLVRPGSWKAYLAAGVIVAVATVLRLLLNPWATGLPFVLFFPAVIIVTFLGGSAAGLLTAVLSILSAWLFILPPEISDFSITRTALFGVGTVSIVAVSAILRATITEVSHLNETLRVSEGQFRGLLESAPDAIIIMDEQCHIVLINAQTETLFGYSRAELLGKPIEMLVPERSRESYLAQLAAVRINSGIESRGQVIDLYGICKNGKEFPIEVSVGLLGTKAGVLVSNAIRDISARRQIEASLAEASKAKSDFLARMSHELRTPLNAIIGFSELIRDAVIAPLDNRYKEYGDHINGAGRHLLNIINDILDISKIEGGHLELRDEIVSVLESITTCQRIVAVMAEAAGVSLSMNVSSALPPIRSDPLRLRQILLNVMSNAVKFTPAGGRVSISAIVDKDGLTIAVEDTGIGMKAEDIAIALEPFRQIDGALSRRFAGTGLGLPLARALVELHGGRLDIRSVPNAGTIVRIRLPRERIASAAA